MIFIEFQNEAGQVKLGDGKSWQCWRMTEVKGLGLPEKSVNTVSYNSLPGCRTLSMVYEPRVITIGGDINASKTPIQRLLSDAIRVLDMPGWLTVRAGNITRRIFARCNSFEQGERKGVYQVFALQFTCDYPFFEDVDVSVHTIMRIGDKIGVDGFIGGPVAPFVFTELIAAPNVDNRGDVAAEPVIKVYAELTDPRNTASTGFSIFNRTTGQFIRLLYEQAPGEVVTIDVPNRRIFSSNPAIGSTLINYISGDTFLSDFWLAPGFNAIEVVSDCKHVAHYMTCEFSNKYVEAVC